MPPNAPAPPGLAPLVLTCTLLLLLSVGSFGPPSVPTSGPFSLLAAPERPLPVPANTCPNSYFYGSSTMLTLQNVVDCAGSGGFSGNLEITFVSMAYQESNFCPGAIEGGSGTCFATGPGCGGNANAEGVLQQGTAGQCPPAGGAFSVSGYSPSSCSTWGGSASDWGGIYFNPLCSFQWALAYYNQNGGGDYNFWGSYLSGAYCKWAPNGFLGTGSVTCSGSGQNQANLPWGTVCPNNVCPSGSPPLTATYSVRDTTNGTALSCGATVDTGDSIRFTVSASGGSSPYTYAWAFGDGGTGTGSPATHTYTKTGSVTPVVTVTDSTGATATAGTGCTFTVVAAPVPAISSFTLAPSNVTVGGNLYANVSASGGTPPLSYSFSGLPGGCVSSNTTHLLCQPTAPGNYSVTAKVTDHRAQTVSRVAHVEVNPASVGSPTVTAFTASPASIVLGGTTYLNATVSGGSAPYSYAYTGLPSGCPSANTNRLVCTPTATGTFAVSLSVTDANGRTATGSTSLQVAPSGSGGLTLQGFTATPATLTLGGTTQLAVSVSGGTAPFTFAYTGLPPGCTSSSSATLACTPTASGDFVIGVTVTDAASGSSSGTVALSVTAGTGDPTIASFTASPTTVVVGGTSLLSVTVSGGSSPYTYQYAQLPPGCVSASTSALSCTPLQTGTFSVQVIATDAAGHGAAATTALTVVADTGTPLRLSSFTASPNPVSVGSVVTFSVTTTGGTAPYSAVYAGLPAGCTTKSDSSLSCTPSASGTFAVTVTVSDALGRTVVGSVSLVVNAAGSGTTGGGSGSPLSMLTGFVTSDIGLLVVAVAAIGVVALIVVLRRRRASPPTPPGPTEWAPYATPPPESWAGPP